MRSPPQAYAVCELSTTEMADAMDELAFMAYILAQLLTSERQPAITFTEEEREAMEEDHIGEDFLRYPFLY